jgi:hypothetical protein
LLQTQQQQAAIATSYANSTSAGNNMHYEQRLMYPQQASAPVCSPSSAPVVNTMTSLIEDDLRSLSSGSSSGYASNDLDTCQQQQHAAAALVTGGGQFFGPVDSFLPSIEDFNFGQPPNHHLAAAGGWSADFWPPSHNLVHNQFDQFAL